MSSTPKHVAVIMDGNGRWASGRGLPRAAGHRAGAKIAHEIVESASKAGVGTLTLFAFSSENWKRPRPEVRLLMDLLRRTIRKELASLDANNVRMHFIGDRTRFSAALANEMKAAEERTASNTGLRLLIAVDYGGRWDIVRRTRELAAACGRGELEADDITEEQFSEGLSLGPFGPPDLFIRTGGERRISNFLLWDLAYSELYFTDVLWPDFGPDRLYDALDWYAGRERRFGSLVAPAAQR
ncbi:polyprenyl diphosphate synthase [Salinisphaera hydrothermalis]|uniref:Ditrans,polycis-undecaprenyl-diphosphate synthase ((2E,6E)-farnesyl-diphosphate specific) n=1 Tax=Salinisphaera hydrothermalis (strain C41B8) TaxID=1304275 RepID=A0A084IK12_SALHC|nr:polyprenyl diphosphate synthase [Salinisphaera hydrothermalis]KEZ77046.1 undecaprenyl diphosphate synthase [Salinisphaera hydrothermalis C41B8]